MMMLPSQWRSRIGGFFLASAGLFVGLCLVTYTPVDIPVLSSHPQSPAANLGGALGAWIGFVGRAGFGWASLLVPLLCFLWAWRLWSGHLPEVHGLPLTMATLCLVSSLGTLLALGGADETRQTALGGVAGFLLARSGSYYLGTAGTILTAFCVGLLSWLVVSGQTLRATGLGLLRRVGSGLSSLIHRPTAAGAQPSGPTPSSISAPPRN